MAVTLPDTSAWLAEDVGGGDVTMEFRPDGTGEMNGAAALGSGKETGTWKLLSAESNTLHYPPSPRTTLPSPASAGPPRPRRPSSATRTTRSSGCR